MPEITPPADNSAMLAQIAELCLNSLSGLSEKKSAELQQVLRYVAEHMKFRERLGLARAISVMDRVPDSVLALFINDVYAVAQPIIEELASIAEDVLVMFAMRDEESYRFSIAKRKVVSIRLTDLILDRGQNPTILTLARNHGAKFSTGGFERLVMKSLTEITLRQTMAARADLPKDISQRLGLGSDRTAATALKPSMAALKIDAPKRGGWSIKTADPTSAMEELRAKLRGVAAD